MTHRIVIADEQHLRDSHVALNPVTEAYEKFIFLESRRRLMSVVSPLDYANNFSVTLSTNNTAPDGSSTALLVQDDDSNAPHGITRGFAVDFGSGDEMELVPGELQAYETYVKAGTATKFMAKIDGTLEVSAKFDLSNGSKISGDARIKIEPAASDTPEFSGWYRVFTDGLVYDNDTIKSGLVLRILNDAGDESYLGTDSRTMYFWTSISEFKSTPTRTYFVGTVGGGGPDFTIASGDETLAIPLRSLATPQAMTIFLEWLETGNKGNAAEATVGVFRVGDLSDTALNSINVVQTETGFEATLTTGMGDSVSEVALEPEYGDLVFLTLVLNADGELQLAAAINDEALEEGTVGDPVGLPVAWSGPLLTINSLGGASFGDMRLKRVHAMSAIVEMEAETGTFGLTGQSAGTLFNRSLSAGVGVFAVTGQPAEFELRQVAHRRIRGAVSYRRIKGELNGD